MTLRYGDIDYNHLRVGDIKYDIPKKNQEQVDNQRYNLDFNITPKGSGEYTVSDFDRHPNTIKNFDILTDYFEKNKNKLWDFGAWSGNDDVSEFMRDRVMRLSTLFSDQKVLKDAPKEVKQAYNDLKADWDRASLTGAGEHIEMIKDYGLDILASPEGILTAASLLFSGGAAAAPIAAISRGAKVATQGATKITAPQVGKTRQVLNAIGNRPVTAGAIYGGGEAGAVDVLEQGVQLATDARTERDYVQNVLVTAIGAGVGAGIGKVAGMLTAKSNLEKTKIAQDFAEEGDTPDTSSVQEALESVAGVHPAEDMPFQSTVTKPLPKIVEETETPEGKAWARYDKETDTIYINNAIAFQKFQDKAWTKPRIEGVTPLPEDQFLNFRQWKDFIIKHEMAHANNPTPKGMKKNTPEHAANENKINEIALKQQAQEFVERKKLASVQRIINKIKRQQEGKEVKAETFEKLMNDDKEFNRLIEELGGSQQTKDEVIDKLIAAAYNETGNQQLNKMKFALLKPLTIFASKIGVGKATAFLTPYENASPTARVLSELITKEYQVGTKPGQKVVTEDLSEAQHNIYGGFVRRYLDIVDDITTTSNSGLSNFYETRKVMDDEINDALIRSMRGELSRGQDYSAAVNLAAARMKKLYSDIGDMIEEVDPYFSKVEDYIPREWNRSAILNNRDDFENLLISKANMPQKSYMKRVYDEDNRFVEEIEVRSAKQVVDDMLDIKNQLDSGGRAGLFFLNKRGLNSIPTDADFQEFLNDDVQGGFLRYIQGASNKLAKARVLGVNNFNDFETKWISKIDSELKSSGRKDINGNTLGLTSGEKARMKDLYQGMTGEGLAPSGIGKDAYGLANRLAYLGFATISSVTEGLLNFGQMRPSLALKGMRDAYNMSFKRMTDDQHKKLMDDYGLTANEAWLELQRFGLAMEQAVSSTTDRLAGEGLRSETMQNISNKFFRYNFLDQWTKFVQTSAFMSGKNLIFDLTKQLAEHGDAPLTRRLRVARDRLSDLGINPDAAIQWHKAGKDTKSAWYVRNILNGASRYSRGIILDVGRMSGVKPRAFTSGLRGDTLTPLIGQLMGYPTAFTNTILKTGAKQLVRDKNIAAEKLVPTVVMMTFVAGFMNYVRDRGQGWEDKDSIAIGTEAAARWGGLSQFYDTYKRGTNSAMYSKNVFALPTALVGPVGSDVLNALRGYPVATLGTKIPGYTMGKFFLGKETIDDYRYMLRDLDKELKQQLPQIESTGYKQFMSSED